jgi:hypothetical protein
MVDSMLLTGRMAAFALASVGFAFGVADRVAQSLRPGAATAPAAQTTAESNAAPAVREFKRKVGLCFTPNQIKVSAGKGYEPSDPDGS